jgi:5-methylcytosine-specific restriction endonuclease McrA
MTMTAQKLSTLTNNPDGQKAVGWYLSRLGALPVMTAHTRFDRVVKMYGYRCAVCRSINPHLTIDHIKCRANGGTSNIENLQLLCLRDHRNKDNHLKKVKKRKIHEDINSVTLVQ